MSVTCDFLHLDKFTFYNMMCSMYIFDYSCRLVGFFRNCTTFLCPKLFILQCIRVDHIKKLYGTLLSRPFIDLRISIQLLYRMATEPCILCVGLVKIRKTGPVFKLKSTIPCVLKRVFNKFINRFTIFLFLRSPPL
jgi:hypothetical protein